MERFDRLFGILLLLREGRPVYTVRGRGGGIRLLDGYFLPPLMFAEGEAIALLVGLALLRGARIVSSRSPRASR